jgi:hypothetical protein
MSGILVKKAETCCCWRPLLKPPVDEEDAWGSRRWVALRTMRLLLVDNYGLQLRGPDTFITQSTIISLIDPSCLNCID